jgi:SHS2 domain-containing protein
VERRGYEVLEHTAETGIAAYGRDLPEIFANAARGMFALMTEPSAVRPVGEYEVRLEASDLEALMVDWLTQLLFLHETEEVYFCEFDVEVSDHRLRAKVRGEKVDSKRHRPKLAVKAVTYHQLEVRPEEGFAKVILDV